MKRSPKRISEAEKRASERFRETVLAKGPCVMAGADACDTRIDPHHVIKRQTLRNHVLVLPDEEARLKIVYDPRVGVPVCRKHHDWLTTAFKRLDRLQVPDSVVEFAKANGLLHALEREVPSFLNGGTQAVATCPGCGSEKREVRLEVARTGSRSADLLCPNGWHRE